MGFIIFRLDGFLICSRLRLLACFWIVHAFPPATAHSNLCAWPRPQVLQPLHSSLSATCRKRIWAVRLSSHGPSYVGNLCFDELAYLLFDTMPLAQCSSAAIWFAYHMLDKMSVAQCRKSGSRREEGYLQRIPSFQLTQGRRRKTLLMYKVFVTNVLFLWGRGLFF